MKRFYYGWAYDEKTEKTVLVPTTSEGRNLSQKASIPQEYCDRWVLVLANNGSAARRMATEGRGVTLAGRGVVFS